MWKVILLVGALTLMAQEPGDRRLLSLPDSPEMNRRAPDVAHVRLETTRGVIRLEMRRAWAPRGVDRFYNLVRHGFYDQAAVFRVRAGTWAQFGINGDPAIAQAWRTRTIPDDPRVESNVRGAVSFAFKDRDGRTTQVFINLRDNSAAHDAEPFVPIGKVIEGMNVADGLYSDYGEQAGGGIRGGKQDALFAGGNDYLKRNFPHLDQFRKQRSNSSRSVKALKSSHELDAGSADVPSATRQQARRIFRWD